MKPVEDVGVLINAFSEPANIQKLDALRKVYLLESPEPLCFLLHEGVVSLHRKNDCLLIAVVKAPAIIGINLCNEDRFELYIQGIGDCYYEMVSKRIIGEIVDQENLWSNVAHYCMYIAEKLIVNHFNVVGVSTYQIIRNCLLELATEDDDFRYKITACKYICRKTNISRSHIMDMLSELKKGGYIDIKRGALLKINYLPLKY